MASLEDVIDWLQQIAEGKVGRDGAELWRRGRGGKRLREGGEKRAANREASCKKRSASCK